MANHGFRRDLLWWSAGIVLAAGGFSWLIGSMANDLHPEDTALNVIVTIACVTVPSSGALTGTYVLRRWVPQRCGPWPFWLLYAVLLPVVILSMVVVAGAINGGDVVKGAVVTAMLLIYNVPPLFFVGARHVLAHMKETAPPSPAANNPL